MSRLLILVAFCVASSQAVTFSYNQFSFCQRYAQALFFGKNATTEDALIRAVVTRAATGYTGAPNNVIGLFNHPLEAKYFNGSTGLTNYLVAPNTGMLVDKLTAFFGYAMGCREMGTPTVANMKTVHAGMMINKMVWDAFVGQIVDTLTSFGVSSTIDLQYAGGLLAQFKKGGAQEICITADCEPYQGYAEYTSGSVDGTFAWLGSQDATTYDTTQVVTVPKKSLIHWNIGSIHNVVEADSTWTPLATPTFTSGAPGATNTFNWMAPDLDATYYFVCNPHKSSMHGKIIVGTGGGLSAAASLSASVAVVLSAIAAAFALRV